MYRSHRIKRQKRSVNNVIIFNNVQIQYLVEYFVLKQFNNSILGYF